MRIWGNTKKVLVSWLERIELYIDNKDDIKTFSPILNSLNIIFQYCIAVYHFGLYILLNYL